MTNPAVRVDRSVDVLVIGGGPGGLAIAECLALSGVGVVEVLERESEAGGIPRHSFHTGYGLRDLHRAMTGPAYARRRVHLATAAGAYVRTGFTATGWAGPLTVDVTSPTGLERVTARAVVLATGARERSRAARWVPGDRPSGVFTTGHLQQAVYVRRQAIGRRAVVVGAEHVSYSACVTLAHAGVEVVAMVTDQPAPQSYRAFQAGARMRWRTPVITDVSVSRLVGRGRLEAVELRRSDGATRLLACDTVVFTGDWMPDNELARTGGLTIDPGTLGPSVDGLQRTSRSGIFAVGNLVHPVETADVVALRARRTAAVVLAQLNDPKAALRPCVPVVTDGSLARVWPNIWRPDVRSAEVGRLTVWSRAFVTRPVIVITQADRVIYEHGSRRRLVPNRPTALVGGWSAKAVPDAGPILVSVH